MKRKLLGNRPSSSKGTTGKQKKRQIRDNEEDSESDEDDYLPLATKKTRQNRRGKTRGRTLKGKDKEHLVGDNKRRR